MVGSKPHLIGIYLFVKEINATRSFYKALGLEVDVVSDMFARASWNGDVVLEFGTTQLTSSYDPLFCEPTNSPSKSTINFELDSASAVDEKFGELTSLGYTGHLPPIDALWQARFAIIEDPDGNFIGLHSPRDQQAEREREARGT